jgi:hypothetical protein
MAALTRSVGISVLVVALVTVVALTLPRPWPALALVAAFVVPLAGYATWLHSVRGEYSISPLRGRFLYARVAPFADCSKVPIPPKERILCPTEPLDRRLAVKYYMWSKGRSPVFRVPADSRTELAGRFAERVIRHQPLAYAKTVVGDALHAFAPTGGLTGDDGPSQWRFRPYYPIYERDTIRTLNRYGYAGGRTRPGLGRALRSYQRVVFVHGPLFAAGLIVSLVAILGLGRARRSGLRIATFLLAALAVVLILGPAATADFTFRYRLPLLVLVPPAAALAVTALTGRPSPDRA